ncbi:MAG: alanine--tRNA ligase [Phycisphaerae bacterium]|nr:alanine--tRNA ligase [Phycisphaerae bacterium]
MPTPGPHFTADQVRRTFIEFFAGKPSRQDGHALVPSSPTVPHDDPTLLFANAGMNQFKPIFLGQVSPTSPMARLVRAVNSQKCIRAGGKHNDLEDVGRDTYHHTFFEMLGNWSFGDYFKEESIRWGFELLTKVYGIPAERLYATYFKGDPKSGLEPDLESRTIWESLLPAGHVIPGSMKDNFWEMGETGPCGPCSEIHYDRVGGRDASRLVNMGDPDVLEIWNHVFIQFNREEGGGLKPLPARHVDTGMGLERLTSVLQNVRSNYDTDLFTPLFAAIERLTAGQHQYRGRLGESDTGSIDTAFRVIADHVRTLTFALTDGAVPSNEGRGYVLRRILRRAVRYGRQMLGLRTGFLSRLVPVVVERMGQAFPELRKDPDRVVRTVHDEEESFGKTLDRGLKLFDEAAARATLRSIAAEDAFRLHDTYGFPIDLTCLMATERGLAVDMTGYERLMSEAREKARSGGKAASSSDVPDLPGEAVARLMHVGLAQTLDSDKFHGHDIRGTVKAIWNGQNFDQHASSNGPVRPIGVVLDRTNFYAEMGGQIHDTGRMLVTREARSAESDAREGGEFRVDAVRHFGPYVLHIGHVVRGELRVGDDVQLTLDRQRRHSVASNHTSTHLLNLALRAVLGDGADQKGSSVAPDRFRFDFAHGHPVTPEQLAQVERHVHERIRADLAIHADAAPLAAARAVRGLRAVFGETYPDPVRVVSIGPSVSELLANPADPAWQKTSIEFCGGTHVTRTSEIGPFAITGEEAVAKGVRRITALSGVPAQAAIEAGADLGARVGGAARLEGRELAAEFASLKVQIDSLTIPLAARHELRARLAILEDRVKADQKRAAAAAAGEAAARARVIAKDALDRGESVIVSTLEAGPDRSALQSAVNTIAQTCPRAAVMLMSVSEEEGKVAVVAAVPASMIQRGLRAGDWVRAVSEVLGGKGGGKPEMAQGGGTNVAKLREALAEASRFALALAGS